MADYFPKEIEIRSVTQMGWAGTTNGKLLALSANAGVTALITADRGIEYQQNSASLPLTVVILQSYRTRLTDLIPLVEPSLKLLSEVKKIAVYRIAS